MPDTTNPFLAFLDDEPEAAFFSRQKQFGRAPQQRQFFEGQFSNIYNQYLGELGEQARTGVLPSGTFNEFLGNIDFDQRFARLTPQQRGETGGRQSQFAPPTRFLFPR